MSDNTPLTLTELQACRKSIMKCIRQVQTIAECAEMELRTLNAALSHIEELIAIFKADEVVAKDSVGSANNKSAA